MKLKNKKLNFVVEEKPSKGADWLISYLDSKIGSRMEIGRIKNIHENIPESIFCKNKNEAIETAKWFYDNNRSCVIKANFGESGWGIIFVKKNNFKSSEEVLIYIKNEFRADSIWNNELILIEEYIAPSQKLSSGSPSSELLLSEKGFEIAYLCDQVLGDKGDFLGVALGKDLLSKNLLNKLRKISLSIGKRFWEMGYRGFFDIDFILSENGTPYVIETNMRRTGGTHVYDAVKTLLGSSFEKKAFIMSQDNFRYGDKNISEKVIIDKMEKVMYPINGDKHGLVISIINKWQPTLGFIIIGKNNNDSMDIYNELLNMWGIKK